MKRREFLRGTLALGAVGLLPGVGFRLLGNTPPIVEPASEEPASLSLDASDVHDIMWRAIEDGKIEVVKSLIKQGFAVNTEANGGKTALHVAACYRKVEITQFLISHGANVNAKDNCGDTPLLDVPYASSFETLRCNTPLSEAAVKGYIEVARLLISAGADVNVVNRFGYTPLQQAAKFAPLEFIKFLVFHGADVNAKDFGDRTPLHVAIVNTCDEYDDIAQFLISAGADVNAKDRLGCTPLHPNVA